MTHISQSKSMLAKLLATENITIMHEPGAKTASFDVKARVLRLPVWQNVSEDLQDMLVVHEVGHALDTPSDEWVNAIKTITTKHYGTDKHRASRSVKSYLNILEDARIDKRQKRRFPGSRKNYIAGYRELIERNFFGTANRDVNSMSFMDRLNIYFKGGTALNIQFNAEEKAWLKRAEETETWAEVEALADEMFGWAKARGEEQEQNQGQSEDDGEGAADEDEDDDFESWGNGAGELEESGDDSDTGGSGASKILDDDFDDDGADDGDDDFVPEATTDEAFDKSMESIASNSDVNFIYIDIPKPNIGNIVDKYPKVLAEQRAYFNRFSNNEWMKAIREEAARWRTEENATISFMVKEFEMRKSADAYARLSTSKTGVIDTNKLHTYKYNDDIFRRMTTIPAGKNHGFFLLLDWSGSMIENLLATVKQLTSLVMFCKRVQIPFEVYTFRDPTPTENTYGKCFDKTANRLTMESVRLRNVLSSRMNLAELNEAYTNLYAIAKRQSNPLCDPLNGTPLNEAIVACEGLINEFRKTNGLQIVNTIVLTDGEANGTGVDYDHQTYPYKSGGNRYMLRDDVMKKDYNVSSSSYGYPKDLTPVLLRILKDRTGSNVIGFFLNTNPLKNLYFRYFNGGNQEHYDKTMSFYRENKFIGVTSAGYDEYYVIDSRNNPNGSDKLQVNSGMTKREIAKTFIKFSEKKSVNRVLLRRFMERVSSAPQRKAG